MKNGESIDVKEFYTKYGPMVLRRCRSLLKDEDQALDAMQETFVKLIRYKDKLKAQAPSSLLYRMATNICLNIIRSNKRNQEVPGDDLFHYIASNEKFEDKVIIRDLLDKIFHKEKISTREIAVLHYVDRLTLEQVAEEVGLSVSGVRKRLRTLKARVKTLEEVEV